MKREIILLVLVLFVVCVLAINVEFEQEPVATTTNYTHIQEQGATGDFDSPVINKTANETLEAIAS